MAEVGSDQWIKILENTAKISLTPQFIKDTHKSSIKTPEVKEVCNKLDKLLVWVKNNPQLAEEILSPESFAGFIQAMVDRTPYTDDGLFLLNVMKQIYSTMFAYAQTFGYVE